MDYLFKIYYKSKGQYEKIYGERYNFSTTFQTKFKITPLQKNQTFQLYYLYNGYTARLIDKIRENDNRLKSLESSLPGIAKRAFLIDIIASELESTNALEGIATKKADIIKTTRKVVNQEDRSKLRMSSMIKSYALLATKADTLKLPIDCNDIRKIYDRITEGEIEENDLPDGNFFRREDVFVQRQDSVNGKIIHKGTSGESEIETQVLSLLDFLHDDAVTLALRVAIAHYYFAYIHPFYDGNGRIGRFISSMFLNKSYNHLTSMSISRGAHINKTRYYKAFNNTNAEINRGELNYFIDEFLTIIVAGQEDIIDNLVEKIEKLQYALNYIENDLQSANTELKKSLLFMLYQNYYFDDNSGIDRRLLIEYLPEEKSKLNIKRELNELENDNVILRVKGRPVIYAVNEDVIV